MVVLVLGGACACACTCACRGGAVVVLVLGETVAFRAPGPFEEAWDGGWRVLEAAGEALFVFEEEAFVGGEEVDGLEGAARVEADGAHHVEGVGDALGDAAVLFSHRGIPDVAEAPVQRGVQVCEAGGDGSAEVVEGGGGVEVGVDKAGWSGSTGCRVGFVAVEDVATKRGHDDAVDRLHGAGSRFGELAGHASDADDLLFGPVDEDEAHLQEQLDFSFDHALLAVVEELCTVAALEQEGVSQSDISQAVLQLDDFVRCDKWRESLQLLDRLGKPFLVFVSHLLLDWFACPARGRPVTVAIHCHPGRLRLSAERFYPFASVDFWLVKSLVSPIKRTLRDV